MKTIPDNNNLRQNHPPFSLGWFAVCLAVLFIPAASLFATATWTGAGSGVGNYYWSNTNNWSLSSGIFGPTTNGPSTSTNALSFGGTTGQNNTNDLVNADTSPLNVGPITMTTSGWNIQGINAGTNVTLQSSGGAWTASVTGSSTWGLNISLNTAPTFTQSAAADVLYLTGVITGTATGNGINKTSGSTGQGWVYLENTNNSFVGQVNIRSGTIGAYSLAPAGQNSSLGAATGAYAPILIGYANTGYGANLAYAGSVNAVTDRQLQFANANTGGGSTGGLGFYNNSPNNSSVTFLLDANNDNYTFSVGTAGIVYPLLLRGTSSGTNTFCPIFGATSTPYWGGSIYVGGPGTWAFSNLVYMTGSLIVSNTAHVQLLYNSAYPFSELPVFANINLLPGATFDVSSYDQNGTNFVLGSFNLTGSYPQVMTAGRTNNETPATDINGSLSLAGPSGATLNVAGTGVPGTLTISSNFITASGTIKLDLDTNTTVGSGTNDLILVGENLDLSQGNAVVGVNPLRGALATNTPYTLISYSGSLIGNASGLSVPPPSRAYNPGVVTAASGVVQVTFGPSGAANANLVWRGNLSPNWDVQATANWLNGISSDYFFQGDNVTFNDNASQFSVNLVGTPAPGSITVSNTANSYTMSSSSSGAIGGGSLTKQGTNELTLDLANSYSGGTVISAGIVSGGNNTALGSGSVTLGDPNTGTNTVSLLVNNGASPANAITVSSYATNAVIGYENIGNVGTFNGLITLQRGVTLYTANAIPTSSLFVQGGIQGTGDVTVTGGGSVKWQTGSCVFSGNIYITPGNNPSPATNTTYLGINANVSTNCNIILASNTIYGNVSGPNINALIGPLGSLVEPGYNAAYAAGTPIGYGNGSGTFAGSFTTNNYGYSCIIEKYGTGTETLTGDNGVSGTGIYGGGGTTINAGTLAVNNTTGYGLGVGGVTVNSGGTLAGNGIIFATNANTFVVNSGGVISVGNAGDTLGQTFTLTNTAGLTISSGGALNVGLYTGAGAGDNTAIATAADVLTAQCPVTLSSGAILNVANSNNMTAWAVGDKWKIANWQSTPTGTFTTLNLPTLPGNLAWDTTTLYSAGVIDIVANNPTQPAQILGVTISGTNIVINGTNLNGGQNFQYAVLYSTNLTLPLTNWTVLSTNSFNANGTFSYTNGVNPANPAVFLDVKAVQ